MQSIAIQFIKLLFSSRQPQARKRLCIPAQLRRASPTPIRWIAQSFSCFVVYCDRNRWSNDGFTFLGSENTSHVSFEFYLLHNLSQYITYKKIDIRNSSEYGVSVGDTQSVNFCVNEFERTCLKLRSSKFEFKFICFQQKFTLLCVTRSWNLSKNSYIIFL